MKNHFLALLSISTFALCSCSSNDITYGFTGGGPSSGVFTGLKVKNNQNTKCTFDFYIGTLNGVEDELSKTIYKGFSYAVYLCVYDETKNNTYLNSFEILEDFPDDEKWSATFKSLSEIDHYEIIYRNYVELSCDLDKVLSQGISNGWIGFQLVFLNVNEIDKIDSFSYFDAYGGIGGVSSPIYLHFETTNHNYVSFR